MWLSHLMFIGAFLLAQGPRFSCARSYPTRSGNTEKYAVIFDAGSSGTRIKVYKLNAHNNLKVSDVQQVQVPKPDKAYPGLSNFVDNIDGIGGYLRPLIEGAMTVVPKEKRASTPIRLFATAGMRLLKDDEVKRILDKVDQLLSNKDFCPFAYESGYSKVITGENEAVYIWVTVNFLKGMFSDGSSGKTFGTLDMGGASTQNTFKVRNRKFKWPTVTLDIGGKSYRVFARSYLGYGEAEARKTYLKNLARKAKKYGPKGQIVFSPCHNKGFNTSVTVDGKDYIVKGGYKGPRFCKRMIKMFFFCKRCAFKDQPRLKGEFYCSSLFNYAFRGTGVVKEDNVRVTLDQIEKVSYSFCSKPVHELDIKKDHLAYARCFHLNYINVMLVSGYKVKKNFVLYNAAKLNGFDLNWTLGAVLMTNHFI